jgi:KUP system potassium uptake protein
MSQTAGKFGKEDAKDVIRSLGLVFGDIGTSPIYTLTVIGMTLGFKTMDPAQLHDTVISMVSLIIWTIIILVNVEYAWLAMSLGEKGEGGTIVLRERLVSLLKGGKSVGLVMVISYIGLSLFIGDSVITPSITILSAVEGARLLPGLSSMPVISVVLISAGITIGLFVFQKRGTERVSWSFGPIMLVWFAVLAISGAVAIFQAPEILNAINPLYGLLFLRSNGLAGFFILSEVILCATGGEALYADMGQLARKPILRGWTFVFFALILNYLGQGAFILNHPEASNLLFELVHSEAMLLYIPFLLLALCASVIASQAMISGLFSVVYQAINKRDLPWIKVEYTSTHHKSQIYIGAVNWLLMLGVLMIIFEFEEASKLAVAYGLAVTGTMTLTGVMMIWIFYLKRKWLQFLVSIGVTVVDVSFLTSNLHKLPYGGYWSLIIASVPLLIILIYVTGHERLGHVLKHIHLDDFLRRYKKVYVKINKIKGTGVFLARNLKALPPYIGYIMFRNNIMYEDNILVSLNVTEKPFGVRTFFDFQDSLAPGLRVFEIHMGYQEIIDFERIIKDVGIKEKAIFYGIEDIISNSLYWRAYAMIENMTPTFVQFYKFPPNKLHGVVVCVEL